jgi:multiple sugar transport system permease protein
MSTSLAFHPKPFRMSSQARAALVFVVPSLLILGLFVILPILQAGWVSLQNWRLESDQASFIGVQNYQKLLADNRFWNALRNTAIYTAMAVPLQIALAMGFALILNGKIRGKPLFRAIFFLPVIVSFAVEAIIWRFLLDPDLGSIAYYARLLHLPVTGWLRDTQWAMPTVILVSVWRWFGYYMVILLAGLQGIPESYYEAATVDGTNKWQRFYYITLPLLRPALIFALVNAVIASLQVFDQIYVMTRGGPLFRTETMVAYIYHQGFEIFDFGYASAAAVILFLIILVITVFQLRVLRYQEVY